MAIVGKLLKNRHAGESGMAWNLPNLAGPTVIQVISPDFEHETHLDRAHASKRAGGRDLSPALAWSGVPADTAELLLVIEDPDAPTGLPIVHCTALLEPTLGGVPQGGLDSGAPAEGARILRSGYGRGYLGPAPIKGHGPHRYVFQLFALSEPITTVGGKSADAAKPRDLFAAAKAHGRGRIDGFYERA